MKRLALALTLAVLLISSCGIHKKIEFLKANPAQTQLAIGKDDPPPEIPILKEYRDTLEFIGPDGRKVTIMNAVKDENGEMVANDIIDAAVVVARFRNVAERHGSVDLRFDIIVPSSMLDDRWQIRLNPMLTAMGSDMPLDSILITGSEFRRLQLKGYQRYERFIESINTDSMAFVNLREYEIFLRRAYPFGVSDDEALEHYTNSLRVKINEWKKENIGLAFSSLVKMPFIKEGIRLDTIVTAQDGKVIYTYSQHLDVPQGLTKADISMSGAIYDRASKVLEIPPSEPITFYISSLGTLLEDTERYLIKVVERRAEANSVCWIDFAQGSAEIDTAMGRNASEIGRIQANLASLMEDEEYDVDSLVVTASCSPEGSYNYNETLARRRSESIAAYFREMTSLQIKARSIPENWEMLSKAVIDDSRISSSGKEEIMAALLEPLPDKREEALSRISDYEYLRSEIYPFLRTVEFDFYLHRKGMVKDTMLTQEPDTVYRNGLRAIREKDYQRAVTLLRPYRDINSAIAFCLMDYNASAMDVLEDLEATDKVEYMKAVISSRLGDDASAAQHYLNACTMNPSFVHRGNLDPEISRLIQKYDLTNKLLL